MKLYGYYRSSASYRLRIILNLKGLDWEYRAVNLLEGEQKSVEYKALNPLGLVPVLDIDEAVLKVGASYFDAVARLSIHDYCDSPP